MAGTYLDEIEKFHRARAERDDRDWRRRRETVQYRGPSLADALARDAGPHVKVIAEIKRRSPSKGWLGEHLDPAIVAREYHVGGAAAISVLTDEAHFSGSRSDLEVAASAVPLPILRKDFTISANDVLDAAEMGASGVLLIAALLTPLEVASYVQLSLELGLSPLVEVHDAHEAHVAIESGAQLIGVNQRDLRTFDVNPGHAAAIIADLPGDVIRVAESGLRVRADVERAAAAGFDAVLVGEVFVTASAPHELVREFATVPLGPARA